MIRMRTETVYGFDDGWGEVNVELLSLDELKGIRVDVYRNLHKKCWSIRANLASRAKRP